MARMRNDSTLNLGEDGKSDLRVGQVEVVTVEVLGPHEDRPVDEGDEAVLEHVLRGPLLALEGEGVVELLPRSCQQSFLIKVSSFDGAEPGCQFNRYFSLLGLFRPIFWVIF